MKVLLAFAAVIGCTLACDSSGYKKIGCFQIDHEKPQFEEIFNEADESFDLENYKEKLPEIVCRCFNETKDNYQYFSVGRNGRCHAGNSFNATTPQSNQCVKSQQHEGGTEDEEYVYQTKADAKTPVDGGANDYGPWSDCSASCGGGKRSRERACVNPLPNDPGKGCDKLTDVEECNTHHCPIDGSWSDWSDYSECSKTCGKGEKERTRVCNNPEPQYDGKKCDGDAKESEECKIKECPIDGGFGQWSDWSECGSSCGKGKRTRSRKCDNPKPQYDGKECDGKKKGEKDCVSGDCVGPSTDLEKCENENVNLECNAGWKIKIDEHFYGRKDSHNADEDCSGGTLGIQWHSNCESDNSGRMKDGCQDQQSCQFTCDNDKFDDPCRGTKKYCRVKYHCEGYDH